MALMRCFFAVPLPLEIKETIIATQKELQFILQDSCGGNTVPIKWVEPTNLHVTIKFLGDVSKTEICRYVENCKKVFSSPDPGPG